MTDCCPTCNRPYASGAPKAPAPTVHVRGTVRRRLVDLVASHPDGISLGRLVELIYADRPNGEPEWAENSIKSIIYHANKQLKPQGFAIKSKYGQGYRLVPLQSPERKPDMSEHQFWRDMWSKPFAHPELL